MRWESIEQILKVITAAGQRFRQGDGIDYSYQQAVNRVSQEYNIAYQTIGDACRRRLGLDKVDEFKAMLKVTFEGDSSELKKLILGKTPPLYHSKINNFFSELGNQEVSTKAKQQETFVTYSIKLRKVDSDVLKALSQLLGSQPEEILTKVAVEAVKERMKRAVNQL